MIDLLVTAIGNCGRWLVQLADAIDQRYGHGRRKSIVEEFEAAGWAKRVER